MTLRFKVANVNLLRQHQRQRLSVICALLLRQRLPGLWTQTKTICLFDLNQLNTEPPNQRLFLWAEVQSTALTETIGSEWLTAM